MLSDEIAAARLALSLALQSGDPRDLPTVAAGVAKRLELLEADAIEWEANATVIPYARLPDGETCTNVVRFPSVER